MTIDRQGACECTSKVATSKMWFGLSGRLQKHGCKHAYKPVRKYDLSPTTIVSTCSPMFVSLRLPHVSLCLLFYLLSPMFVMFLFSPFLVFGKKYAYDMFSGLLTSSFSFRVSTFSGRSMFALNV